MIFTLVCLVSAGAQERAGQARQGVPGAQGGVSPVEVQQMFDAYVLMQAQEQLALTDTQYAPFLARLRALQAVRRRGENQRMRVINELRRVTQPGAKADDAQIRGQLQTLAEIEARAAAETKQAIEAVDEVLDVRQQARFRVLEEQMERRKVELLMRARQANRRNQF
jgi:hypothetical protein